MKVPYQNELYELRKWIDNTNANLSLQLQFFRTQQEIQIVKQLIITIAAEIQVEYQFYVYILPQIASILFQVNNMGTATLNPAAFGELVVIIRHIDAEPFSMRFWTAIHARNTNVYANYIRTDIMLLRLKTRSKKWRPACGKNLQN